jgi:S-layer family protein
MNNPQQITHRALVLVAAIMALIVSSSQLRADTGTCGGQAITLPFTDVPSTNGFFCAIAQAYFTGLTSGSSATTYSPGANVTREQMAAFLTRTMDQSLKRGSARVVAEKWWTPQTVNSLTLTTVGFAPKHVKFDGTDVWVAKYAQRHCNEDQTR